MKNLTPESQAVLNAYNKYNELLTIGGYTIQEHKDSEDNLILSVCAMLQIQYLVENILNNEKERNKFFNNSLNIGFSLFELNQ